MTMKWSSYALNRYIAPKLADLERNLAPEVISQFDQAKYWVGNFIFNSILRVQVKEPWRKYIFNFLRCVQTALHEYECGRGSLDEYLAGRREAISRYFMTVLHFETSVAHAYQAYMLGRNILEKDKLFTKGDGSPLERLNRIYNHTKHYESVIAAGQLPDDATIPLWITNDSLECSEVSLSFDEFAYLLVALGKAADQLSNPPLPSDQADQTSINK